MDHVVNDCRSELAASLILTDAAGEGAAQPPNEVTSLSALWTELINGSCKVQAAEFTELTCALVVTRAPLTPSVQRKRAKRLSQRDIEVLEQSLLAGVRKSVAVDFGLCPSSIAEILRRGFAFMGLSCWPSRMPLLLVMAAHAEHMSEASRSAKLLTLQNQQISKQTFSAARPDLALGDVLSPAEHAVTRLLIEGHSYTEIAQLRGTSRRTVANQIASAFRQLGVSGRAELLCSLATRHSALWRAQYSLTARPLALVPTPGNAPKPPRFARVAGERR
jgi:DNA-binding CsgD family transcriptional regulator